MAISHLFFCVKLSPVVFTNVYVLIRYMSYVRQLVCATQWLRGIERALCVVHYDNKIYDTKSGAAQRSSFPSSPAL